MLKVLTQLLLPFGVRLIWRQLNAQIADKLLWRLQKVEKRMAQMKQKEDLLEKQIASAKHFGKASEVAGTSGLPEKIKAEKLEQTPSRKRKRQQHSKPGPPSKVKRYTAQSDKPSDSPTLGEEDSGTENSDTTEEDDTENEDSVEGKSANNIPHKELLRTDSEEEGESEEVEEKEEEEDRDPHPKPVLRTECLYHVSCCVEQLQEESMDVPEDASEKDVITGDQVETPGWRINVLTNRYQLEGTENITDEAYQKRHQKHELEEKRRKRWDIQRLREQRVFEKLRGKEQAAASSVENCQALKTFLPCIEDLTHIEISESVPVMAFGRPIPPIHASEFELPWDTSPPIRKSQGRGGRQK
ncbi:uncharacterized protein LOC143298854 isoform X2 [Babylonia areolata]|uniref:uncharacterized protein LOC143298854 isoform X2 n=1 Tax=Babylonia areolata TaxID=304850 RepID=UPI003FD2DE5B